MIPKNLKPGDTFEDGGRTFVVEEICAEGYISRMIEKQRKSRSASAARQNEYQPPP